MLPPKHLWHAWFYRNQQAAWFATEIPLVKGQRGTFMNMRSTVLLCKKRGGETIKLVSKRWIITSSIAMTFALPLIAQSPELQQKLAAVQESMAANKMKLQKYQWTETTQLTLNGDPKPPSQNICRYGPDGQVQKTLISPPPPPPSGGRLKQRVVANKTGEMQDYMAGVKSLLALYLPPDPQKMQQAFAAGNASLNPANGLVNIIFKNYAQPGDQMTITFDPSSKKVISVNVQTYMGQPSAVVTLQVQMSSLPDGTSYAQQTVLNATAKNLVVTTTNSGYQMIGG
jgi:hypothetical protein